MIVFEIRNKTEKRKLLGYLFYYERSKRFFARLLSELNEWDAPFIFSGHVKKGEYDIDFVWSRKFVEQRIIPRDRQNLGSILKENGLKIYDECKLLQLSEGRCAQDELYVVRIPEKEIVPEIRDRLSRNVIDVMTLRGSRLIVFFKDGVSRLIDIKEICEDKRIFGKILRDEETFKKVKVSPGGNGIEWDEERFIQTGILRKCGRISDICYEDINGFMIERLSDTAETMRMLNCSRQYVKQLSDMHRLKVVRENGNTCMYSKGALEAEV
ncbi:MAG: DUF2442 domain-containing protein [Lachnospiraceae bacterium]|nr:DUF2442 domain-containing protein [Lachnospiraceae bacterium]